MKRSLLVSILLCTIFWPDLAKATDPRDYIPLPAGSMLFCTYLQHTTGHRMKVDDEVVSSDFNLSQNIVIFRPVYYTNLGPFVVDPQALIIAGEASLDGDLVSDTSSSGIADPVLLMTTWFVNNPEKHAVVRLDAIFHRPHRRIQQKTPPQPGDQSLGA